MGLLGRAKQLDDVVLGRSDSTRGFVMNALFGMHPLLAPVYAVVATTMLGFSVVLLAMDHPLAAAESLGLAAVCAAKGYASKRLPRQPRS
jgi:hypothetical protein